MVLPIEERKKFIGIAPARLLGPYLILPEQKVKKK